MKKNVVTKAVVASTAVAAAMGVIALCMPTHTIAENKPPTKNEYMTTPSPISDKCSYSHPVDNYVNEIDETRAAHTESATIEELSDIKYTEDQLDILALIIYQEAGGDMYSDDTRLKVGSVFLNRVASDRFPDTFEEVAIQRLQYGLLYRTGIEWPSRAREPEESNAVLRAYDIAEKLLNSGSVLPANVIWQAEFPQGDGVYSYQDDMYFCYTEVKE